MKRCKLFQTFTWPLGVTFLWSLHGSQVFRTKAIENRGLTKIGVQKSADETFTFWKAMYAMYPGWLELRIKKSLLHLRLGPAKINIHKVINDGPHHIRLTPKYFYAVMFLKGDHSLIESRWGMIICREFVKFSHKTKSYKSSKTYLVWKRIFCSTKKMPNTIQELHRKKTQNDKIWPTRNFLWQKSCSKWMVSDLKSTAFRTGRSFGSF